MPSTPSTPTETVVPELSKEDIILGKLNDQSNSGVLGHLSAGAAFVGVGTYGSYQLQSCGLFLISDGRVRSQAYFGNQYESPLFVSTAKQAQQKISALAVGSGMAGNLLTTTSIITDSYRFSKGGLSTERFLFNTTGNTWSLGLALTGSGLLGGLIGLGFYGAGLAYDYAIVPVARKIAEAHHAFERALIETSMDRGDVL